MSACRPSGPFRFQLMLGEGVPRLRIVLGSGMVHCIISVHTIAPFLYLLMTSGVQFLTPTEPGTSCWWLGLNAEDVYHLSSLFIWQWLHLLQIELVALI